MFDVLTIFLMSIVVSFSLGGSIRLTSSAEPDSGLTQLSYALMLHGLAYCCLFLSQTIGPFGVWLGEACFIALFCFSLSAITSFHHIRVPRLVYVALLVPNLTVSAIFAGDLGKRILFNTPILLGIVLFGLVLSIRRRRDVVGRGQYLVMGANALVGFPLFYRGAGALIGMTSLKAVLDTDLAQTIVYLTSLIGLNLLGIGFVLMAKERTDHSNSELILKDKLLGIWNRRKIEEVGAGELRRLLRYGTPVSLLMIDIDNFKPINDHFGHAAGDRALKAVTHACASALRETDTIARWGGEEFVVILPDTGVETAMAVAEQVRASVAAIKTNIDHPITVSIGVSLCISSDSWGSWLDRADAALYRAKAAGKNRVFFEIPLHHDEGVPQIRWSESFTTGIESIDAEHLELVLLSNELLRLVTLEFDKDRTLTLLGIIASETARHFDREEELLAELHPAELDAHRHAHKAILARFDFLKARLTSDALSLEALVQFIVFEMCAQHMAGEDRRVFRAPAETTALCA